MGHWNSREEKAGKQRQLLQGGDFVPCWFSLFALQQVAECLLPSFSLLLVFLFSPAVLFVHGAQVTVACPWHPQPKGISLVRPWRLPMSWGGARVLARTETDGYYHLGRIVQEVKLTVYWELVCKSMYVFSLFFPYHTSPKPLLWGGPPVLQCTS